jgi:hypothetical protein
MANRVYASPGVYTSEKDLTFTTETLGVTTLGLSGETMKGPAFQPIFIRNYDEFKVTFGGTNPEKFRNTQILKYELPYIAKSYLSQSNQLFVTRVLGLSGYDAGNAYVIRTLGGINRDELRYATTEYEFEFSVNLSGPQAGIFLTGGVTGDTTGSTTGSTTGNTTGNTTGVTTGVTEVITYMSQLTGVAVEKFDNLYGEFFNIEGYESRDWYKNNVIFWGLLNADDINEASESRNQMPLSEFAEENPTFEDAYELPTDIDSLDRNEYFVLNEFNFNETIDEYENSSFSAYTHSITATSPTIISGKIKMFVYNYLAEPNQEYHKKTLATLRSRGRYVAEQLFFTIDSSTVSIENNVAVLGNPLEEFDIVGTTTDGSEFLYSVSLDRNKRNYIKNVLGQDSFDNDAVLYVEEVYDAILRKGFNNGLIKGLHPKLALANTWDHYRFQFQSPCTPFFVSELRGGVPQRLFRLISISDGTNANFDLKVSIANVDLDKKTFDLYIRDFKDSDRAPQIIERYISLSMDETQDNFIGRRIGTIDNKYPLRSSYVIVELAENFPKDGIACGFEGYEFRTFGADETEENYCGVPDLPYKTKYYSPGEVISDAPFATPVISTGDKIRKVYLGFTNTEFGFDMDLLKFKGKQRITGDKTYNDGADWTSKTKGFHLDINAGELVDFNGNAAFDAGVGTFVDPLVIARTTSHPYHDIRTRKFTALFSGGFDGWDIYREQRTNIDIYKIGRSGFLNGRFETFNSIEFDEIFGNSDYYAYLFGIKTFENPEQIVINILATPGIDVINNTELVRDAIEVVEERRFDSIYLPTLPDIKLFNNTNPSNSDDWLYPNDIISELINAEIDSNYTAVYYPWIQISDNENVANIFIPPTAEVVRNLALTDNVAHPWFATAGYNRGIVNCIKARIALDQESRDVLYPERINPIATFSDVGNVIWGNRNLQVRNSALNRLNIRRLLLQARKLIVSVANRLLFDPNDAQVRSQFLSLVNPILDNIRRERGLTDFRVALVNEVEDSDRNTLRGRIFIKPTPTLEFIELEFVVTPTSVSFDNL